MAASSRRPEEAAEDWREAPSAATAAAAADEFVKLRAAFESIEEGDGGRAVLKGARGGGRGSGTAGNAGSSAAAVSDREFEAWFHAETGRAVSYCQDDLVGRMDPAIAKEVADVTEGMSPGGLDKGGMWELAASIRRRHRDGDGGDDPLRLGAGAGGVGGGDNGGPSRSEGRRKKRRR